MTGEPVILIVEDELPIMELLQELFEAEGYQVLTARNGREGLERLREVQPHLVLADVMMPLLDGRALCRIMQANPLYRAIPLVLMSAVAESALNVQDECGYAAFVRKPFDLESVLQMVAQLIN